MHNATGHGGESLTVHQWLGHLAPKYLEAFGPAMPARHRQVLKKILATCTAGGYTRVSLAVVQKSGQAP